MRKTHGTYCVGGLVIDYSIEYVPGRDAVMYLPSGDPGYPAEPAEMISWDLQAKQDGKEFEAEGLYVKYGNRYIDLIDAIFLYAMENEDD